MSILSRIGKALIALSDEPEELPEEYDRPGWECRWIEIYAVCRLPLNESENMPTNCDARCPARISLERAAQKREHENMVLYR